MSVSPLFAGIDVAKAELVVALGTGGDLVTVANTEDGIRSIVERLQSVSPALIVLEATGGYETSLAATLATGGLPVVVANRRQVRDFAKATG